MLITARTAVDPLDVGQVQHIARKAVDPKKAGQVYQCRRLPALTHLALISST